MTALQQMLASLQNDISGLTGQFSTDGSSSSANSTGSSSSAAATAATTASSASSTPSAQFANDTLTALIQAQSQSNSWESNAANTILSADGSNGQISLGQVTSALGSSGSTSTAAQITSAFKAMDTNGDGELSASELTAALQQLQGQTEGVGGGHHHHHHISAPQAASASTTAASSTDTATDAIGTPTATAATATDSIATGAAAG